MPRHSLLPPRRLPCLRVRAGSGATLLVLCLATVAAADLLHVRGRKAVQGAIVKKTATEVVFNIYWSRNPGVVNPEHLVRVPLGKVKKVEERPHPEVEVWRRWKKAKTADEFAAVGTYAKEHKLKAAAHMCFAQALALDEQHKDAIKGLGGRGRWGAIRKGNPLLDHDLQALLERYVGEDDPAARVTLQKSIKAAGFKAKPHELERWRRSTHQPVGYQRDRPLSYRSDLRPGAVYTLYVPKDYTPVRPWPLIIGLHGGGADGKAGDEVVGSGPSAMNFYQQNAARFGFLVACPTALRAGWPNKVNEDYVRDLITELRLLYHIDIDRIYLTGHSMGGYGTWGLGPRMAEDFAAISPMAGAGGGIGRLVSTKTPIFIFHGADDKVVGVASDRNQAKQLLGSGLDFVYTELDHIGHGFPPSVQRELFEFFEPRRRYDKKYKQAWPRSSFLGKVSKDEVTYLGDPLAEIHGDQPNLKVWLAHVRRGGGRALAAITQLVEQKPEGAVAGLMKILGSANLPFDARAYAARALGAYGDAAALPALRKAVAQVATKEQSRVARACAKALVAQKDAGALGALGKALGAWAQYYESKVMGEQMRYSDWHRVSTVLADLTEAWAALAPTDASPGVLEKAVVRRVLAPQHKVQTSKRVPQDPSTTRTAIARAVAQGYKRTNASGAHWSALFAALANDERARAAAASLKP